MKASEIAQKVGRLLQTTTTSVWVLITSLISWSGGMMFSLTLDESHFVVLTKLALEPPKRRLVVEAAAAVVAAEVTELLLVTSRIHCGPRTVTAQSSYPTSYW